MRNQLIFDGLNLMDYGVWISGKNTLNAPQRDVEAVSVPGRNGSLTLDNGRFQEILVTYPCYIRSGLTENMAALRTQLLMRSGYKRLEDTFHPDEFRLARFTGGVEVSPSICHVSGSFDLEFSCRPERFLKSGEFSISMDTPGTLYNHGMPSKPLITVYGSGSGTVTVSGVVVSLSAIDGYTVLDCDIEDAYKDLVNKNSTISAEAFPVLQNGDNQISWSGGVTKLEIIPRWWIL